VTYGRMVMNAEFWRMKEEALVVWPAGTLPLVQALLLILELARNQS